MKHFHAFVARHAGQFVLLALTLVLGSSAVVIMNFRDSKTFVPAIQVVELSRVLEKEERAKIELGRRKFELCVLEYRTETVSTSEIKKCAKHLN